MPTSDFQYFVDVLENLVLENLVQDVSGFDADGNPVASGETIRRIREIADAMANKALRLQSQAQTLEQASKKLRRSTDLGLLDSAIGVLHTLKGV